ncbi:hypothetical protein AB0L06_25705 [Spirillospora sp. NPDC052269]
MIRSRRWRRHRRLAPPLALLGATFAMGAAAISLGAAGTGRAPAPVAVPPPSTATPAALGSGPHASSVGVNLAIRGIPAIGQPAFSGRLGTAGTQDASDRADYSHDPDHVKSLVTVAKPSGRTSGGAWAATSAPNAFGMALSPRGPELLRIATLHTDARCRPPQVRTTLTKPTVAGVPITAGETQVPVTGAQLGYGRVSTGLLIVRMTRVQRTTSNTAEARAEITIDGTLFGESTRIYSGRIARLVLGDVQAQCPGTASSPEPADLIVRKTVDKARVHVGGPVRYTLTAQNDGGTSMDARFEDDMTRLLRHGVYNADATASKGRLTYQRPRLTWTGHLSPGQEAKITFTITARRVGKMRNVVVWDTPSNRAITQVLPKHAK